MPQHLGDPSTSRQWELLARHHGLPSAILDWTTSPYVAAFFAFADEAIELGGADARVAIWAFDRAYFAEVAHGGDEPLEVLDNLDDFRFNVRAIEQEAVFMRVHAEALPLEQSLGKHLRRFVLPAGERTNALTQLNEMRINYRNLFRDLDHAARTAAWLATEA